MNEQFMREAIELAKQARDRGDHPFGAVIVHRNKVIAKGTSHEQTQHDVTKHAETQAVSLASKRLGTSALSECEVYASGEPCTMCASAIFQARIKKVYIGATRDDLPIFFRKRRIGIKQLAEDSSYRPIIINGLLHNEALALFSSIVK